MYACISTHGSDCSLSCSSLLVPVYGGGYPAALFLHGHVCLAVCGRAPRLPRSDRGSQHQLRSDEVLLCHRVGCASHHHRYAHTRTRTRTDTHIQTHRHMHTHAPKHTHINTHAHKHTHIHHTHIHNIYTHMHARMQTHTKRHYSVFYRRTEVIELLFTHTVNSGRTELAVS